jgi:hypothetical protein
MKIRWLAAAGVMTLVGSLCLQGIATAAAGSHGTVRASSMAASHVRGCSPRQLRVSNGPRVSEKTQQNTEIFVLRNASSRRCKLDGYPVVSLHTAAGLHGRILPFRYRNRGDQMLTSAKPHRVVLARGGRAYFGINKQTCVGHATAVARYIYIYPLGQLHHRLTRHPVLGYCGRHDPGHTVDISPFEKTAPAVLAGH